MKVMMSQTGFLLGSILMFQSAAHAQLPALDVKGWYGRFIGLETRTHHFGLTLDGKGTLAPIGKRGDPVSSQICPTITFLIEESLPDGRVVARQIRKESLTSDSPATTAFEKISFTGKVTGDAAFAVDIEANRGVISLGGRLTDPGTLTNNPLKFIIRVTFPSAYRSVSVAARQEKAFLRRVQDDRLDLVFTDGKRFKQKAAELVDVKDPKLNGPGISDAKLQLDAFQGKLFEFTTSGASHMTLWSRAAQPLHEGFTINWESDPEKDPDGNARLVMVVK